jgi:hypothetical protein
MPTHTKELSRFVFKTCIALVLLCCSSYSFAWSKDGHSAIGVLAMKQLQPGAYSELQSIIGPLDEQAMIEACNWPDDVRDSKEWEWSSPQHYINIPRGETEYLQSRDCPDKLCATEAIKTYAEQLFDDQLSQEKRKQAFAWLCHITADLHQPLHAGFADDRGGNNYDVIFKGEEMNLHSFWDFQLVNEHAGGWQALVDLLSSTPLQPADSNWSKEMVNQWTAESHKVAAQKAYPEYRIIDKPFALRSWVLAQQQISLAASRLASIINSGSDGKK